MFERLPGDSFECVFVCVRATCQTDDGAGVNGTEKSAVFLEKDRKDFVSVVHTCTIVQTICHL